MNRERINAAVRRLEEIGAEFASDLATGAEDVPDDPRVSEAIEIVKKLETNQER